MPFAIRLCVFFKLVVVFLATFVSLCSVDVLAGVANCRTGLSEPADSNSDLSQIPRLARALLFIQSKPMGAAELHRQLLQYEPDLPRKVAYDLIAWALKSKFILLNSVASEDRRQKTYKITSTGLQQIGRIFGRLNAVEKLQNVEAPREASHMTPKELTLAVLDTGPSLTLTILSTIRSWGYSFSHQDLHKLHQDGFIRTITKHNQTFYQLTAKGKQTLRKRKKRHRRVSRIPQRPPSNLEENLYMLFILSKANMSPHQLDSILNRWGVSISQSALHVRLYRLVQQGLARRVKTPDGNSYELTRLGAQTLRGEEPSSSARPAQASSSARPAQASSSARPAPALARLMTPRELILSSLLDTALTKAEILSTVTTWGAAPTERDVVHLRHHKFIRRLPGSHQYQITAKGRRALRKRTKRNRRFLRMPQTPPNFKTVPPIILYMLSFGDMTSDQILKQLKAWGKEYSERQLTERLRHLGKRGLISAHLSLNGYSLRRVEHPSAPPLAEHLSRRELVLAAVEAGPLDSSTILRTVTSWGKSPSYNDLNYLTSNGYLDSTKQKRRTQYRITNLGKEQLDLSRKSIEKREQIPKAAPQNTDPASLVLLILSMADMSHEQVARQLSQWKVKVGRIQLYRLVRLLTANGLVTTYSSVNGNALTINSKGLTVLRDNSLAEKLSTANGEPATQPHEAPLPYQLKFAQKKIPSRRLSLSDLLSPTPMIQISSLELVLFALRTPQEVGEIAQTLTDLGWTIAPRDVTSLCRQLHQNGLITAIPEPNKYIYLTKKGHSVIDSLEVYLKSSSMPSRPRNYKDLSPSELILHILSRTSLRLSEIITVLEVWEISMPFGTIKTALGSLQSSNFVHRVPTLTDTAYEITPSGRLRSR